jgi:hypothetical protein
MAVFCDVVPCSLVEIDDVVEVRTVSIIMLMIALIMGAVNTSETSVNFY